jgi:predicted nucleic acid-binding protein
VSPVVVDASALVAMLIVPGDSGEKVAEALLGMDLHAPDLLPYEVANVLRRHCLAGRLSPTEAALAHQAALRLPIELWAYEVLADRVWSLTGSLSAYDAAYVALAERIEAPLVTCDARLARGSGYQRVVLV